MNMLGMVNLSATGIFPGAQLLAAQIAAAGGAFGQSGPGVGAGLGTFGGLQGGMGNGLRGGPGRSGGRSPGLGGSGSAMVEAVMVVPQGTAVVRRRTRKISTRRCCTTWLGGCARSGYTSTRRTLKV